MVMLIRNIMLPIFSCFTPKKRELSTMFNKYWIYAYIFSGVTNLQKKNHATLLSIWCYILFLSCKWRGVGKKWRKRGGGVVGKFSFRVVCQNIIPLSLIFSSLILLRYRILYRIYKQFCYLNQAASPALSSEIRCPPIQF